MTEASISAHRDKNDWKAVRKMLHRHPEISGQEKDTARTVARILEKFLPDRMIRGIGGTGILAIFEGADTGPVSWFRAELDALPIRETDREHRSVNEDVAHLCGHDGHMSILLQLAEMLRKDPLPRGRIGLLFQPAEETGTGAEKVLASRKISRWKPDRIFALHNLPGYPAGQLILRSGHFTSSVISLIIRLRGRTSHAAEPDKAVNPGETLVELWTLAQKMNRPDATGEDHAIVTPVHINLGRPDYGVTPGYGELHLTLRTWSETRLMKMVEKMQQEASRKAGSRGLEVSFEQLEHFPAVINDEQITGELRKLAERMGVPVLEKKEPFSWGEDFSRFLEAFPGNFIGWGAGKDTAPLHHPDYDFPDDQIEPAARFFYETAKLYHG